MGAAPDVLQVRQRPPGNAWSDLIEMQRWGNQSRFPGIRWQFLGALPIAEIEPSPAFPANDELLLKSLERTAIEAVRFNGTGNPVLSE
jgi:hypothetical protein